MQTSGFTLKNHLTESTYTKYVLIALAIFVGIGSFILDKDAVRTNLHSAQYDLGMFILCIFMSLFFGKIYNPLVGWAYAYYSLHTAFRIAFVTRMFPHFEIEVFPSLEAILSEGLFQITAMLFLFSFFKVRLKEFFMALCVVDSGVILFKIILQKDPYFIFNNPAIDSAFIACCIPMFMKKKYSPFLLLAVGACILTKTSTGILGLGVAFSSFILTSAKDIRIFVIGLFCSPLVALIGAKMQGKQLVNGSGRYEVWKLAIDYLHQENPLFGFGSGTFAIYGPALQMEQAIKNNLTGFPGFFWAHNDWLQIAFELGYFGLLIALFLFAYTLFRARKNPELFSCIMTFGAVATTQMPLRWFIFSLLGMYLFMAATKKKDIIWLP